MASPPLMQIEERVTMRRGGVLITALAFTVIITVLLTGVGTLVVSHMRLVRAEADYAAALDAAEAGINYELRKISQDANTAGKAGSPHTGTVGSGSFSVYCLDRATLGTWTPPDLLYIRATGTVNGYSRTVQIAAKAVGSSSSVPNYTLFGVSEGIVNGNNTINGDVGTDGSLLFNGHATVNGGVYFNGPGSNWQGPAPGGYNVTYNPNKVNWPSVETIASQQFPQGGLPWIATHNDNLLAIPPITSASVLLNGSGTLTFTGKPGGANYYLTSLILNGNCKVAFNNALGPITIWVGPSGASGTFTLNGGNAVVPMSTDPAKGVRVYLATKNDVTINGNNRFDGGIYNVNNAKQGRVINNGNPTINGSLIANKFTFNGNVKFGYTGQYFAPQSTGPSYYGFDGEWTEL